MKVKFIVKRKRDGALVYAKENCKRCYGRGIVGFNHNQPVLCSCVFAVPAQPEKKQDNVEIKKLGLFSKLARWIKNLLTKKQIQNIPTNRIHHVG